MDAYVIGMFVLTGMVALGSYYAGHAAGATSVYNQIELAYGIEPDQLWEDCDAAIRSAMSDESDEDDREV